MDHECTDILHTKIKALLTTNLIHTKLNPSKNNPKSNELLYFFFASYMSHGNQNVLLSVTEKLVVSVPSKAQVVVE